MTRRERIELLLYHYVDVENGLQDRAFRGDDYLPRMCRAWSHPSYSELRRLIQRMQTEKPVLYWPIAETYFRFTEVVRAECPRCGREYPPSQGWYEDKDDGGFCRHGQSSIKLVLKTKRKVSQAVSPFERELGLEWLDKNFLGEPFIPDDLLPIAA